MDFKQRWKFERYSPPSCPSFSLFQRWRKRCKILKSRDNKILWGLAYILNLRGSLPLSLTPGINFRSKFFPIRFFERIRAKKKKKNFKSTYSEKLNLIRIQEIFMWFVNSQLPSYILFITMIASFLFFANKYPEFLHKYFPLLICPNFIKILAKE